MIITIMNIMIIQIPLTWDVDSIIPIVPHAPGLLKVHNVIYYYDAYVQDLVYVQKQ